jgi:phosphate-selective porin OprO/OprP
MCKAAWQTLASARASVPAWVVGILMLLLAAAHAAEPSVQLGPITLSPYTLLQVDEGGTFNQSRGGGQATGSNLRRARVGFEAALADQLEAAVIWDFGGTPGSHSRLFEADIAYTGAKPFTVRAGVFKPAFTLEYAQSAADILFLERASIINVAGGLVAGAGRVGGQIGATGERWFAAALLTGGQTGPGAQSDQRAVLGRVAGLAVKTDTVALHLGTSAAYVYDVHRNGSGQRDLGLSDQPEFQIDNVSPSLSTGSLAARAVWLAGAEAGLAWGGLWLQSEFYAVGVDRAGSAGRNLAFNGWYLQAAYTLFGTPRKWSSDSAAWGRPSPREAFDPLAGQWGALELGARFSTANLDDADVRGGRQRVWTVGASWYPTKPVRIMLQYQHADITAADSPRRLDAALLRGQLRF